MTMKTPGGDVAFVLDLHRVLLLPEQIVIRLAQVSGAKNVGILSTDYQRLTQYLSGSPIQWKFQRVT